MDKIDTTEIKQIKKPFDYQLLDAETAQFLKMKELNMRSIASTMINQLSKELVEAQEKLAGNNQYDGMFEKWYTSLGFKKRTVYNYINRYKYIARATDAQAEFIEGLPSSLTYEMSKPSADPEINKKVFDKDITSFKEYKKIEKENKELQQKVKDLEEREPEIVEKTIEKIPDDYEYLKDSNEKLRKESIRLNHLIEDKDIEINYAKQEKEILERKARLNEKDSNKYKQLQNQIENLSKQKDDLGRQVRAATELSGFAVRMEKFLKDDLAPIKYSRALREAKDDEIVKENLKDIVDRVQEWCNEMYQYTSDENIIYTEVITND